MNLGQFVVQQTDQFVVLLDGLQRLHKHGLTAGAGAMHHSLHPPLVFHFHRDDEALAADRHQFVLCRAAFRQTPQISAERFLNGAALLFDLAPNARQLRRSSVFQSSIG